MWFLLHKARYLQYDTPVLIGTPVGTNILMVNAVIDENLPLPLGKRTYKYAGRLTPVFEDVDIGTYRGKSRRVYLGNYQIEFDNPLNLPYRLELLIHLWTPQLVLTLWESDQQSIFDTTTELALIQDSLNQLKDKVDNLQASIDTHITQ